MRKLALLLWALASSAFAVTPFNYNPFMWDQSLFSTLTGGIRPDHVGRGVAFMPDSPIDSVAVDSERIYTYSDFTRTERGLIDHSPSMIVMDGLWEPGTPIFQSPANPWSTQPQDGIFIVSTPNGDHSDVSLECITGGSVSQSGVVFQFHEGQFSDWTLSRAGSTATLTYNGPGGPVSASLPCTTVPLRRSHACERPGATLGFYVVYSDDLTTS